MTVADLLVTLSQAPAATLVVKATALFALGLLAATLSSRGRASVRHLVLATTFLAVAVLPLVSALVPAVEVPLRTSVPAVASHLVVPSTSVAPAIATDSASGTVAPSPGTAVWPSAGHAVLAVWALGAVASVVPLIPMALCTRRLRRTALPWPDGSMRDAAGARVLRHDATTSPITFGFWRPMVLLPVDAAQWPDDELQRALVHELEHVRRRDWGVQLAARLACAVYWFHPLAWAAWRRLCLEAERACDDAVVVRTTPTDYAAQLVALAERLSPVPAAHAVGMARRSDLATRVTALLDGSQARGPAGVGMRLGATTAAVVALAFVSPVRAVSRIPAAGPSTAAATASATAASGITPATAAQSPQPRRAAAASRLQHTLDVSLYEAADDGDVAAIGDLTRQGANVNAALRGDGSPLIAAARNGHLAAVATLLDRGADPNLGVPGDGNALIAAARDGHTDVVRLLLDRGAAIDHVVPGDENALITACAAGALSAVRLLVDRGADVNARVLAPTTRGDEWRTPLSQARRGRHAAIVTLLERAGARQ